MKEKGPVYYPLGPYRPLHAHEGCWVYFMRGGMLVSRAKADRICQLSPEILHTYTGEPTSSRAWQVECSLMELARTSIPHRGFQGFRYVTPGEQARFEAAFK